MGLDITAYRRLTKAEGVECDEDGEPVDWNRFTRIRQSLIDYTEEHWNGRAEGVEAGVYERDDDREFKFRAGSYSGYNAWRDDLARFAGHRTANHVWESHIDGPFVELIDFSDCEGIIGPVVAAKLAKDFADHQERADKFADEWFRQKYADWRKAFEMAADGGAVDFH